MKITKKQIKQLIREELEKHYGEQDDASFWDEILFEGSVNEVDAGQIALGLLLAYASYKAYGPLKNVAQNILYTVGKYNKQKALQMARDAQSENLDALIKHLSDDDELISMLERMDDLVKQVDAVKGQGVRTPEMAAVRKEAKELSSKITQYTRSAKRKFFPSRPQQSQDFGDPSQDTLRGKLRGRNK